MARSLVLALVACFQLPLLLCARPGSLVTLDVASVYAPKSFAAAPPEPESSRNTADILHRAALFPSWNASYEDLFLQRMKQDELRIQYIQARISRAQRKQQDGRALISSQLSSGLSLGNGEYVVRVSVGTPPVPYYLVLDTGSDVTWLQCAPCNSCFSQVDPIYNPENSASFQPVSCGSQACLMLDYFDCQGTASECIYQVIYADESATNGELGLEDFTMGSTPLRNVAFGCGHTNTGFQGEAGLMGMGGGSLSFISQVGGSVGRTFSYCLVNRDSPVQTSSPLVIGPTATPFSAQFSPLLRNPMVSTFYYADLIAISVGAVRLPVDPSVFRIASNGTGGVIVDSGTTVTRLVPAVYSLLREAYRSASRFLLQAAPPSADGYFDTCFDLGGVSTVQIPSLVLHLENGVDMFLPGHNILIPVDGSGTFCLAFGPWLTSAPFSIIGNVQQQTFRIGFDLRRSLLSIAPRQC